MKKETKYYINIHGVWVETSKEICELVELCEEDIIDFAQKLYKAQKITLEQRNYLFNIV